ncbi:MAG: glutathione S-transferase family protein [Gammaproteobacteria bacterium]|nr:glutathione S-transferase family protein [Gammaproteobacteria bacterium]
MGLLVDGVWRDNWYDTDSTGGRFVRSESQFRHRVSAERGARFAPEKGRYHLYVSLACPWAHRTLILRKLKGLEDMIDVSVVHPLMLENGWEFATGIAGATGDPLYGFHRLYELYLKADPQYSGRVTVPVLWDKHHETIVSNESAEIIRMFGSAFDGLGALPGDYYPPALRAEIDALNERVYDRVNNGVYKAGFATTQEAYAEAVTALFAELEALDQRLGRQRYLLGDRLTEADWRLFTTLVRFDAVYVGHFKCNLKRIVDFAQLHDYLRDLYQVPGVAGTVNFEHIKLHYYGSHRTINPTGIVPLGPEIDLGAPHGRERPGQSGSIGNTA